jgi:itaconyl-CoA hydratase
MTDPDFDAFPLAPKGHQFEDFQDGQLWSHHWGRTLTDADNALFCAATCTWNPLYGNAEFARAAGHRDAVVSPMLVLCTVVGLSVEDLTEAGGPFLGLDDCHFHIPVYPGDTLTARSTVLQTRTSTSRPGVGIVTWHTEARNQEDTVVLDFRRTNLVVMRGA